LLCVRSVGIERATPLSRPFGHPPPVRGRVIYFQFPHPGEGKIFLTLSQVWERVTEGRVRGIYKAPPILSEEF
jgi:hypothetical protein